MITIVQVVVYDNNVEQALRTLKKKVQREGLYREIKARRFHEKPTTERKRCKNEAVRRERKRQRKERQILGF